MKKLYLHVGFGKTGSSALQSWLANNVNELSDQGFSYKLTEKNSLNYKISSGNGAPFCDYLAGKLTRKKLEKVYFDTPHENIIISSEVVEIHKPQGIQKINSLKKAYNLEVYVVVYIRDIYNYLYSHYVQRIKRNNFTGSFEEYILEINGLYILNNAEAIIENYPNRRFIHYDACVDNISIPFAKYLGLDLNRLKPMKKAKVNRSLNLNEVYLVKQMSKWAGDMIIPSFSRILTDGIIHQYPEKVSEVVYSKVVFNSLTNLYRDRIKECNLLFKKEFNFKLQIISDDTAYTHTSVEKVDYLSLNQLSKILLLERKKLPSELFTTLLCEILKYDINFILKYILNNKSFEHLDTSILIKYSTNTINKNLLLAFAYILLAKKCKPNGSKIRELYALIEEKFNTDKISKLTWLMKE